LQQPAWWDPGKLLTATARVLDAHRSLVLLGDPDIPAQADAPAGAYADNAVVAATEAGASRQSGLELLLRPPVQAALGSREENLALIDRWLAQVEVEGARDRSAVAAVREVREALQGQVSPDPKGLQPSVPGFEPDARAGH